MAKKRKEENSDWIIAVTEKILYSIYFSNSLLKITKMPLTMPVKLDANHLDQQQGFSNFVRWHENGHEKIMQGPKKRKEENSLTEFLLLLKITYFVQNQYLGNLFLKIINTLLTMHGKIHHK